MVCAYTRILYISILVYCTVELCGNQVGYEGDDGTVK